MLISRLEKESIKLGFILHRLKCNMHETLKRWEEEKIIYFLLLLFNSVKKC